MKKYLLTLLVLSSSFLAFSQGSWSPRASLPDSAMVQGIPGFSIGNYGYAGLGDYTGANPQFDYLWQFNPSLNTWIKMASFPGKARIAPACFVICGKAYLVCGSVINAGSCINECWEYDANNDTWTRKADFPGGARTYAVGFAIDSLGYVGTGANELQDFYRDFYAYHPSTDTWTRIADFGGIARDGDCGFGVNGKGYVCFGQDSTIKNHNDMWEYDPIANTWAQKSNSPGPGLLGERGFAVCDNIYVGCGDSTSGLLADDHRFWKYNTSNDTWSHETNFPKFTTIQGTAFAINDTGYYGFGMDSAGPVQNKFYKFFAGDNCNNYDSCFQYLGITNLSHSTTIAIFPNPVKQTLYINFSKQFLGPATLSVMDITGRELLSSQFTMYNSQYTIDVSSLSTGMYFINLKTKDLYITQKFIKQ